MSSNIGRIKGAEDCRWRVYADVYRRLAATVFLAGQTTLLVVRIGLKTDGNIASRESNQHC